MPHPVESSGLEGIRLRVAKRRDEIRGLEIAKVVKSRNPSCFQGLNFLKEATLEPGRGELVAITYLCLPQLPCVGSKNMSGSRQNI